MANKFDSLIAEMKNASDIESVLKKNKELKDNKEFFFYVMENGNFDEDTLSFFSEKIKDDNAVILKVSSTWPHQDGFKHASLRLRNDKEMAFTAIKGRGENIEFISDELKNDEKFMLDVISSIYMNNACLKLLPEKYRSNKEFVSVLIKKDYQSFPLVCDEFKNDSDMVWSAMFDCNIWYAPVLCYNAAGQSVKSDKDFFKKASDKLKEYRQSKDLIANIKEAHKLAVANSKGADAGAIAKIKSDLKTFKKEFSSADSWSASKLNKEFTEYLASCKAFSKDKKVMELVVEADLSQKDYYAKNIGQSISLIDKSLLSNQDFLSQLIEKTDGKVFPYLPIDTRKDKDFIISNFNQHVKKECLPKDIIGDGKFMLDLVAAYKGTTLATRVKYILDSSLLEDKKFIEKFILFDGSVLEYVSEDLKEDKAIVKKAFGSFKEALMYASPKVLKDIELLKYSISIGADNFISDLSLEQLSDKELILALANSTPKNNTSVTRSIMRSIPYSLKKDKDVCLACVSRSGWALENVDDSIKYDKDILTVAFKTGAHVYKNLDLDKLKSMYTEKELKKITGNLYDFLKNE